MTSFSGNNNDNIVARDWWELRDDKRGGRSYYYRTSGLGATFQVIPALHYLSTETVTKKTQWTRPSNVLVIPLAQVQTQLQVLRDAPRSIPETSNINIVSRTQYQDTTGWKKREQGPAVVADDVAPVNVNLARESNDTSLLGQPIGDVGPTSSHTSLAAFHPARTQAADNIQPWNRYRKTPPAEPATTAYAGSHLAGFVKHTRQVDPSYKTTNGWTLTDNPIVLARTLVDGALTHVPVMHKVSEAHGGDQDVEHRRIIAGAKSEEPPSLTHRLNAITSQEEPHIPFFRTSSVTSVAGRVVLSEVADKPRYSDEFFAVHRKGLTRKRLTQHELMKWQSRPSPGPLLAKTTPSSVIDCPKVFKVIQHIMGDRDLPVEGIVPPKPSEAATRLLTRQKSEATEERDQVWEKVEKTMLLDEMRWLLHLGIRYSDLRDEVYAMTIKQVNDNPLSIVAYEELCRMLIVAILLLSIAFEDCCRQLPKIARRGAQLRAPMYSEIENAGEAAFNHIIFGESLQIIMQDQAEQYPHLRVPVPLVHSAEAIIQLGGLNTRGIFLSMGDPDVVSEVKARFERYQDKLVLVSETSCAQVAGPV
ncbi:hypothetical protein QFC19_003557 [Naganishia cerealis]|uniref:Uncharacterized protein n=1 Tax=Naganishia cerealis TaxID=610337 RepID=A0ACC2W2P3_9TREE|nr:hypothetical protein QFC19_003557 [Naganishia cerealis]